MTERASRLAAAVQLEAPCWRALLSGKRWRVRRRVATAAHFRATHILPPATPTRRYRTQCAVSGVCSVVLVLLMLMQLGTLLSVWDHLYPRWPYFPLVFFQCANLAAVLAMQVRGTGGQARELTCLHVHASRGLEQLLRKGHVGRSADSCPRCQTRIGTTHAVRRSLQSWPVVLFWRACAAPADLPPTLSPPAL